MAKASTDLRLRKSASNLPRALRDFPSNRAALSDEYVIFLSNPSDRGDGIRR